MLDAQLILAACSVVRIAGLSVALFFAVKFERTRRKRWNYLEEPREFWSSANYART